MLLLGLHSHLELHLGDFPRQLGVAASQKSLLLSSLLPVPVNFPYFVSLTLQASSEHLLFPALSQTLGITSSEIGASEALVILMRKTTEISKTYQ